MRTATVLVGFEIPYVMWAGTPYQHLMAPIK